MYIPLEAYFKIGFNKNTGMWCIYTMAGNILPNRRYTTLKGAERAKAKLIKEKKCLSY